MFTYICYGLCCRTELFGTVIVYQIVIKSQIIGSLYKSDSEKPFKIKDLANPYPQDQIWDSAIYIYILICTATHRFSKLAPTPFAN